MNVKSFKVLFTIFDEDGDGSLSNKEFIGVMKNKLKRGLEKHAYLQDEIILQTRYPAARETRLSGTGFALVHFLSSTADQLTYSAGTSQRISLNSSLGYYIVIMDPTFSVTSGNPETVPRSLVTLPIGGMEWTIYLKVRGER